MKRAGFCFLTAYFLFHAAPLFSQEGRNTLERILVSLSAEKGMVKAEEAYNSAMIGRDYNYLQWWRPSLVVGNDLAYPYKRDAFEDLMTADTASISVSLPLPTGTVIEGSAGYGMNRGRTDALEWGFSQDVKGKIGIGQSLNPWWAHTRRNPYRQGAVLQMEHAKNEYNIAMKNILFTSVRSYIELRKSERNASLLTEKINLYDDLIASYRQTLLDGGISVREYQNLRKDKWEFEQALFAAWQNAASLQNELYRLAGMPIDKISGEELPDINGMALAGVFLGLNVKEIARLEQTNIEQQRTGLHYQHLIDRQSNAPLIKVEFGSSFLLPARDTDNLGDVWKKERFTDGELNNWSVNVSIDLSNLLSPINRKRLAERRLAENTLNVLAERTRAETEAERKQNAEAIKTLETYIERLAAIVDSDSLLIMDVGVMYRRGGVSEMEYRQITLEYKEKKLLLENYFDDLWLYRFLEMYFF